MRFLSGVIFGVFFMAALAVAAAIGPAPVVAAIKGAIAPFEAPEPVPLVESTFRLSPLRTTTRYEAPEGVYPRHEVEVSGVLRVWHGFGPAGGPDSAPRPAIVLLHGSGRNGAAMVDMWRAVAAANDLVLIAPDSVSRSEWSTRDTSNATLAAIVEDAAQYYAVDNSQLYLFGHSAGAAQALRLAMAQDGPWRAVGVHGGDLPENRIKPATERAVPVTIFIGDRDETFPLDQVRATAQALAAEGHVTELVVMPDHDHWYYDIGPRLSSEVLTRILAQREPS